MIKNKKGFTLIELMSVLIIIALITLIIVPTVRETMQDSRKKALKVTANEIMKAGDKYYTSKLDVDETHDIFNVNGGIFIFGNFENDNNMVYFTSASETLANKAAHINISNLKLSGDMSNLEGYMLINTDGQIEIRLVDASKKICAYKNFTDRKVSVSDDVTFCGYSTVVINSGATFVAATSEDKHKGIVYLNPTDLSVECDENNSQIGTGNAKPSGCMKFYVYDNSGSSYKMILDHNIADNVPWISEEDYLDPKVGGNQDDWDNQQNMNIHGPVTALKRLAEETTGWIGEPRLITADEIAHIVGADSDLSWKSSNNYGTDISQNESSWFYLDGAQNGNDTYSSADGWQKQVANSTNQSQYYWLYDYTRNCENDGCQERDYTYNATLGYWTSSKMISSINSTAWFVSKNGSLNNAIVDGTESLRPVITISKSLISSN